MKRPFITTLILCCSLIAFAQGAKEVFTFRITGYMPKLDDSTIVVQVEMADGSVGMADGQVAILRPNNNFTEIDTAMIGWGRCNLVKGTYFYFSIHVKRKDRLPQKGDLLITCIEYPTNYKGQIFKLLQNDIYFERLTGGRFYTYAFPVFGDRPQENSIIDSLVEDIKFTAREMLKQDKNIDRMVSKGKYKDKMLFTAMQNITSADVKDFIDYVIARPLKYAGNNWKVSETFATWVDAGAPMTLKRTW